METEIYALITGASKGIGREIALQLAEKGYGLLLVARSEAELQELSNLATTQFNVGAYHLSADLTHPAAPAQVKEWVNSLGIAPSILVNNAGYGLWGTFETLTLADQENMLNLNIMVVVALTHLLLPVLKQNAQSYILNISSVAAYQCVPTLAVYSASKSFVLSFSRALRYELKDCGVSVSCLCPGPTATNFANRAGMSALAELAEKFNMQPQQVAKTGLNGMFKKRAEIVPGILNRVSAFSTRLLPKALIERVTAGLYK